MTTRQTQTSAERRAARVLAMAGSVAPAPLDRAGWDEVLERAARPRSGRLVPAFVTSAALGVLAVLGAQRVLAPPVASVVVTAQTQWAQAAPGHLSLQQGRLIVPDGAGALTIDTPFGELASSRAAFLAEVSERQLSVVVEHGDVAVRLGGEQVVLHDGQSLRWPSLPATLQVPVPMHDERCSDVKCLETEALGSSLDAQAALYELGALRAKQGNVDAAVATWRESLQRFPSGVLAPEARIALFVTLLNHGRVAEARAIAADFEQCCADDPRAADVRAALRF